MFFLNHLLLKPNASMTYPIPSEYINELFKELEKILDDEPMFVRLRAPVKIFGDIHGQLH